MLALAFYPTALINDTLAMASQGANGLWAMREDDSDRAVRISPRSPLTFNTLDELVAELDRLGF